MKTTTGGQTAANTVIVGQKVSAKVESSLEIVSCGWDGPSGGNYVKNYITTDSVGQVVTHATQDYYQEQFDFYYTGKGANQTTGIGAYMVLRDANGKTCNISDSVSYYLESPTATIQASVGIFEYPSYQYNFIFGDYATLTDGMKFQANFATSIYGAGKIAFTQTVIPYRQEEYDGNLSTYWSKTITSQGLPALDGEFPYKLSNAPVSTEMTIGASTSKTIITYDSPGKFDLRSGRKYSMNDTFFMYAIYKPNGSDCIWVPLQVVNWDWGGFAREDILGGIGWYSHNTWANTQGTGCSVSTLPEWEHNINYYVNNMVIVGDPPL